MKSFILSIQGVPKLYYDLEFQDRRYLARKLGTKTKPVQEVVADPLPPPLPPAPPPSPEPEIVIEEPQTKTTKTKAKSKKKA
jgi:hypothetical protein